MVPLIFLPSKSSYKYHELDEMASMQLKSLEVEDVDSVIYKGGFELGVAA